MRKGRRHLRCRVEDLGDGWDAVFVPGVLRRDAAVFLTPHRDGADGLVEVEVVGRARGEAVVELPEVCFLTGGRHRCRVPLSALAA